MSDIIEGTAVVLHQEKPREEYRFNLTIKAKTDHKLQNLTNQVVVLEQPQPRKDDAWTCLVPYILLRVNRKEVQSLLRETLFGTKPVFKKTAAGRFEITFNTHDTKEWIETYILTFIDL